jgi:leucyl aminopeptidase
VVVGLGERDELTPHRAEKAGAAAAAALNKDAHGTIIAEALSPALLAHAALGARLRSYRFDQYHTQKKPDQKAKLRHVTLLTPDLARARSAFAPLAALAAGVERTRDLVSEPANILTPAEFADRAETLEALGVKVEVFDRHDMEKLGFGALLGVAQGSANEPRMVVMQWLGASRAEASAKSGKKTGKAKPHEPLVFIGKGVTFDTGGISIKPAAGMEDMKWDMAGAGTVVGLMAALAGRKARVDAVGLIGLVENMPSGTAQRPGDVVKSYAGKTIEVLNTDAEGRLVLADVLAYAQKRFAIIIALGHEHAGLFCNDESLAEQLVAAGTATGEEIWPMPLSPAYDKLLDSDIADVKNISGSRGAGAVTAAQFLQRFVDTSSAKMPWAHLDIAGMAWASKEAGVTPKGATAFGVRLLDRLVSEHYEH